MGSERSFNEILLEKMEHQEEEIRFEEAPAAAETRANTAAFESFFSQLHNTVDAIVSEISGGTTLKKTPYAQAKKPAAERQKRAERTKLRSQLSTLESVALSTFVKYGATELLKNDLIGESAVKKTYRKLAVDFHPDRNPTAQGAIFRELHDAYVTLAKMFKA